MTFRMRKRRPFESWSWTKSTDQRALGLASNQDRRSRAGRALSALSLANHQAFLAVEALRLLPIQDMTLAEQENMQPAIAEAPLIGRQLPQAAPQVVVGQLSRTVADRLAIGLDQATRPALAHLVNGREMGDSLALGGDKYNETDIF